MWKILKDGSAHNPDTIYSSIRGQELVAFFKTKKEAKRYIAEQVSLLNAEEKS